MDYTQISYDVADGIATITLDRPDHMNAYTAQMHHELIDALDRTDADDDVRVVIFTGRGRAFCAGADLSEGAKTFEMAAQDFAIDDHADGGGLLTQRLFESNKPLIAAINGSAVGVGLTMTLPMDFRLVADNAKLGFVFARRGIVPEACSSWFLPRIVGIAQASEWVLTGRIFRPDEALRGGLVRSVHSGDELLAAATELAREIADNTSPVSVAMSRAMLWRMLGEDTPNDAHEIDSRGIFSRGQSGDAREGVMAFLEKRPAAFPDRVSTDVPDWFIRWKDAGSVDAFVEGEA
ncbi:MAG: crotonase/enoyl-CoA hydratase family protein [Solirubrobacteraceae bacterium]|nr:crotonase/enoyl-CoA hydratase family protein [Solirubrobacteraceae bacterium]